MSSHMTRKYLRNNNRKPLFTTVLFAAIILLASNWTASAQQSKHFQIEKLSDGVWAAIHTVGGGAICNAGIVDLGDKTLVFDTFLSTEAARDLKSAAVRLTGRQVSFIVNSHAHNDHIRGNVLFKPFAAIIATQAIRDSMAVQEPVSIAEERVYAPERLAKLKEEYKTASDKKKTELSMWIGFYEAMVNSAADWKLVLPEITFDGSLNLHGKDRSVTLMSFEGGHSASDIVLFLPEERILFAGDLMFVEMHPYLGDGDPDRLTDILQQLIALDPTHVVPGHGRVGRKKDITTLISYVEDIVADVRGLAIGGADRETVLKTPVPGRFSHWAFQDFYQYNLGFLYGIEKGSEELQQ